MVEPVKPFALFLWLRQHRSHHTCDVNYMVFTAEPSNSQFHQMANQSKLVALPQLWISSCDPDLLSKENSEVKKLHWNRLSASGKRTKFVHLPLYIQISNTAMNALSCSLELIVMTNSFFLLQWQRSIQGVSLRSGMGLPGKPMYPRPYPENVSLRFPQCSSICSRI